MQAYSNPNTHHYAIDAAKLVERCRSLLHSILNYLESHSSARAFRRRAVQLVALCDGEFLIDQWSIYIILKDGDVMYEYHWKWRSPVFHYHDNMKVMYVSRITVHCFSTVLKCVDRLIHTHLLDLLSQEMEYLSSINDNDTHKKAQLHQFFGEHTEFPTLMNTVKTLRCAAKVARECRCSAACSGGGGGCHKANSMDLSQQQQQSMHKRIQSNLPAIMPGGGKTHFLSIDDPIEDDSYGQGGWYYSGRRSPSPPPPLAQSAGDSSPSQTHHRRAMSDSLPPSFPILSTSSSSSAATMQHSPLRSTKDSSLFRLIVTLQLCLVRLEEANSVLCNGKADLSDERSASYYSQSMPLVSVRMVAVGVTIGSAVVLSSRLRANHVHLDLLPLAGKASAGMATASLIRRQWRILCMNARIANSAAATEDWILQWICLVNNNGSEMDAGYKQFISPRKVSLYLLWTMLFELTVLSLNSSCHLTPFYSHSFGIPTVRYGFN